MYTPLTSLRELRKRAQKSQEQLAAVLHITRSAYSKLERNQTELSVKRACQIAQFLAIPVSELLPLPTPNPAAVGGPAAELLYLRAAAEHSVLDAYIRAGMAFQENIPFDELDENCWVYLDLCGIKTREEYEATDGLITRPVAGSSQHAFEQILRDPGIYALFEHGIIQEAFLLDFWQVFKAKAAPYFEFEDKLFGAVTKPLLAAEPEPGADAAMISSWPEPLLFGPEEAEGEEKIQEQVSKLPPVNWTEISQDSDARLLAWELAELVFYNPNPAFAHLRHNPAEYARTLARLVGLAWVVESTSETVTSIDMLQEEAKQLAGEPYSREFQAACEVFASRYREAYR
jgi:transcriptional regulator with XRE-family HTH domain